MKNNDSIYGGVALGTIILILLIYIFIGPFLTFWLCYFMGIITKLVIGKMLVEGLALLNINITMGQIPLIAGTLGWIASFFKGISRISSKEN